MAQNKGRPKDPKEDDTSFSRKLSKEESCDSHRVTTEEKQLKPL